MTIVEKQIRWRIMIGLGTDRSGNKISTSWARETALNIAEALDAYSITDGRGSWLGVQEPSLVIEHIGSDVKRTTVFTVAETIARYLDQAEVWISEEPVLLTRIIRSTT